MSQLAGPEHKKTFSGTVHMAGQVKGAMAENISKLKKTRGAIRTATTKLLNKIEGVLLRKNPNVDVLQELMEQLTSREKRLMEYDKDIKALTEADDLDEEVNTSSDYLGEISATKIKCRSFMFPEADGLPWHWDPMPPDTSCHIVPLSPKSAEYTEVLHLFQVSCSRRVLKIERIQNPILWKSLEIKRLDMEQRNGHQNNVRRLFHGTCYTTLPHINQMGFNRSYAGQNAAAYGNGTYFAVRADYSAHDSYSKPDPKGQKFMYLCLVVTGDFTQGKAGMIVPPAKTPSSIHQFDSVVDNLAHPSMFVVFHDSRACPEYLITFI